MNNIIKDISKSTGIDIRVVTQVVNHPLKFLREMISSDDVRPIRIKYLGVFTQKIYKTKQAYAIKRIEWIKKWGVLLSDFDSLKSQLLFLDVSYNEGRYNDIGKVYYRIQKIRRQNRKLNK